MATPFNPNEPIPNDPFNYERTASISGPLGPIEVGSGLEVTPGGEMIAVGGGPAVTYLTAGSGIYVNANTGSVRIVNTGVLNLAAGTGIGLVRDTNNGTWTITNTAPAVNVGGTVTQVNTGDGLVGGPITTSGTIALSNTGVAPGTYQNATVTVDAKGRVTAASPGSVISTISGTNPIVVTPGANATISINEGSSTTIGALRVCDAINVSCSSIAASSTAVKNAYDVATAALPCSILTAQGDLISAAGGGVPVRVPAGADGSFLKVCTACAGTGGLTWDSLTFCEGTVTSVSAGNGLTGGTITTSGTIALDTSCVISPTLFASQGALLTATGPNAPTALGVGSNGQLLSANNLCSEGLEWVTPTPSVPCSAFNVKGDILVATGPASYAALPVGANGTLLLACSACTEGVTWVAPEPVIPSACITGKGALITGSVPGIPSTLPVGANGYVLSANSTCLLGLEWVPNSEGDVTSVQANAPLTVDNTDPQNPVLSVDAASLTAAGVVQLNNTVSSTSTTQAATANAVKGAYDEGVSANLAALAAQTSANAAQADATQALSDAAAAQGTADQAVIDAAAAQLDATAAQGAADQAALDAAAAQANATQALSDSAAAQGDATQALADASTAQSTANQALLDAGAAQDSADLAGLDAQAAQADATQALSDAAAAQATANAALPLSGGTLTGPVTFAAGQTIPVSSIQSASTLQAGIVQLNDTISSTSTTQALTANQGKNLQDQITALSVSSNITLGGTFDANTGLIDSVTAQGTAAGLVVGSTLPAASPTNSEIFVIVDVQGSTGPSGTAPYHTGDWFLSDGTTWQFLNVGYQPGQATTTSQGTVQLATDAQVQAGTDSNNAVVSSALQSKLSDSTSTTSSTTIASSTAVKSTYDLAAAAIPCSALTSKGSLISASAASTPVEVSTGSNGQVLTVCTACASGLAWVTPAAGSSAATPTVAGTVLGCTASGLTSLGACALLGITSGTNNVSIGGSALRCTTTGYSNTAVGNASLCSNLTGFNNTAVGHNTLATNTASQNTAVGSNALAANTSGVSGTAVGFGALFQNNTGIVNTAIGVYAGCNITSGGSNVAIGCGVTVASGTASCQLAIGFASGQNWLTGNNTKAIKPGAGIIDCADSCGTNGQVLMSNGSNAICWGPVPSPSAATPTVAGAVYGCNITTGPFFNTAFGFCANLGNGGALNTAVGHQAMAAATSGTNNTAVGHQAACALTSGVCNTLIGTLAGRSVTTGVGITAIGRIALCAATGSGNTGLGNNVGNLVTSGTNNTLLGACAGCNLTTGSNNVAIGFTTAFASATESCQLAIGFSATDNWITGNSTKAIKPGAGIIDCADSCGTAGQVLMSDGANAICWGTVSSGSGTVTSITAGTGLTGGAITTSGTIALDTACVIAPTVLTSKGDIITATAASTPAALSVGTNGQVLTANSACASGLSWATPQTSPFVTYTTSAITYTNGTSILVAVWGGGTMQGTVTLDMVGYGGFQSYWDFYLTGDATNGPSGWVQPSYFPPTSDGRTQGTWGVDYPVYPSPNNGLWEIYFNPTADALNPSSFTFFYRLLGGGNPSWQI